MKQIKRISIILTICVLFIPIVIFARNGQAEVKQTGFTIEGNQVGARQINRIEAVTTSVTAEDSIDSVDNDDTNNIGNVKGVGVGDKSNNGLILGGEAIERRSRVANAVQEMLVVADRNGGIGQQVRVIAQQQKEMHETIEQSVQQVKERSKFVRFLIGPRYQQLKNAEDSLQDNRNQYSQKLEDLRMQMNQVDADLMNEQIQKIQQVSEDIGSEIKQARKGFSLFGWVVKMFVK